MKQPTRSHHWFRDNTWLLDQRKENDGDLNREEDLPQSEWVVGDSRGLSEEERTGCAG